jgi:branched-chain amino acid transport system substrate-binding protein
MQGRRTPGAQTLPSMSHGVRLLLFAGLCLMMAAAVAFAQGAPPYRDLKRQTTDFHTPSHIPADVEKLEEIRLGFFGPADPQHPVGGSVWQGISLAIEDENSRGGYQGRPFRVLHAWSDDPWKGGIADVVKLVYRDRVWALIGGIEGSTTHLAEQVVAKALLPLIDPVSTDGSVSHANVPWMFSCLPDDKAQAEAILTALEERGVARRFILLSATDHDSRALVSDFKRVAGQRKIAPRRHVEFDPASGTLEQLARETTAEAPEAFVVLASAAASAAMIREIAAAKPGALVYAAAEAARHPALPLLRKLRAEIWHTSLIEEGSGPSKELLVRFRERFGMEPDYAALQSYDATRLLIAAIQRGGLERTAIREALLELSPWPGEAGLIRWDHTRRNVRQVTLRRTGTTQ